MHTGSAHTAAGLPGLELEYADLDDSDSESPVDMDARPGGRD